jgi:hypothetical protein
MRKMESCQQACNGEGKFKPIRKMRGNRERMLKGEAKSSRDQFITNESENRKRPDEGDARTGEGLGINESRKRKERKRTGWAGRSWPDMGIEAHPSPSEEHPFPGGRQQTTWELKAKAKWRSSQCRRHSGTLASQGPREKAPVTFWRFVPLLAHGHHTGAAASEFCGLSGRARLGKSSKRALHV